MTTPERVEALVQTAVISAFSKSWIERNVYPATPSCLITLLIPSLKVFAKGGNVVCIRTLIASNGHSAISARNSALALAAKKIVVLLVFGNILSP